MVATEQPIAAAESPVETGPFKFLDYFIDTPEDRRRFGGREREIRELVARIANEWTLVLYGRSGIGKTSLILTGVFPELEARGYRPVYARTLTEPIRDLCKAVGDRCNTPVSEEDLRASVERAVAGGPLVIVLDQFEEFFIRFRERPEIRSAFVEAVAGLVNDRSLDLTVVFSLREDYLAALDDFRERIPDLFENQYRLKPLTAFGVRQAISRPLTDAGISYDEAVVSRLVDQLEESGFDPPVLQIICSELYREAIGRAAGGVPRITLDDVKKVGDLDDIFRRCLDGLAEAIPEDRTLLARMILDAMITGENTKQAVIVEDLLDAQFSAQEGEVREILGILVQQRLLRRQLREGEPWYELIHERLISPLKKWLDSDQRFYEFRQARDFVETNGKSALWLRNPKTLLNAGVLTDLLGPHKERFRFRARALELILRSAVYRHNPDVDFWARCLGVGAAIEILLAITASPNKRERNGAAIAAGLLTDPEGVLATACLRLALEDPEETVRRSAGLSLARLARKNEISALQTALRRKDTRRRARQILTDLRLGGYPLKEFSWLRRRFAREEAERRLRSEHREILLKRRRLGMTQGLVAGLVWVVFLGGPLTAFRVGLSGVTSEAQWYQQTAGILGGMLVAAAIIGGLLGRLSVSAISRDAAATREDGRWLRALAGDRFFFYGTATFVAPWIAWYLASNDVSQSPILLGLTLVLAASSAVIFAIGFGLLLLVSRAAVWPPESRPRLWAWCLLASLGVSGLLLAVITLGLHFSSVQNALTNNSDTAVGFSALVGLAVFVSLVAIASADYKYPLRHPAKPSTRRRRWSRIGALTGALLIVSWIGYFCDLDVVPPFASLVSRRDFDSRKGLFLRKVLGSHDLPGRRYFQICNPTGSIQFTQVEKIIGTASLNSDSLDKGDTFLLPPGCHLGSIQLDSDFPDKPRSELKLIPLPSKADGDLHKGEVVLTTLVLRPSDKNPGTWHGLLEGKVSDFKALARPQVRVVPLWIKPAGVASRPVQVSAFTVVSGKTIGVAENYGESNPYPEKGRRVELNLPPHSPMKVSGEFYWPIAPDSHGFWKIEFRVPGIAAHSYQQINKIDVPVLQQLVDLDASRNTPVSMN